MVNPQDVKAVIRRLAEARDEPLWKILYFKCQRCSEIKPIGEAVGWNYPTEDDDPPAAHLDPQGGSSGTIL
jgi:hypothetical protein